MNSDTIFTNLEKVRDLNARIDAENKRPLTEQSVERQANLIAERDRVEAKHYAGRILIDGHIPVNQGWRPADVLAVIGDEALAEYEMPNGTTALSIIHISDGGLQGVGYKNLSRKWIKAMHEHGTTDWTGLPQRNNGEHVPFPALNSNEA